MTRDSPASSLRTNPESPTSGSGGEAIDDSPSAEEIERIVEVAELLKIDPQLARIALEAGSGGISTDCRLSRSVAMVETRLTPRD